MNEVTQTPQERADQIAIEIAKLHAEATDLEIEHHVDGSYVVPKDVYNHLYRNYGKQVTLIRELREDEKHPWQSYVETESPDHKYLCLIRCANLHDELDWPTIIDEAQIYVDNYEDTPPC